jgi:hypothetical protein
MATKQSASHTDRSRSNLSGRQERLLTRHTISWGLVAAYLLLLYATLPIMPRIWKGLDALMQGKGVWPIYAGTGLLPTIWLVLMLVRGVRAPRTYFAFILLCGVLFGLGTLEDNPGEKIHILQYAILGILLYSALFPKPPSAHRQQGRRILCGALICLAAGATDELIQYFLSGRTFTWHDVLVNGTSAVVTLFILILCLPQGKKSPASGENDHTPEERFEACSDNPLP